MSAPQRPHQPHHSTPRLGAHVSVAGGLEKAFDRAEALSCTTMQIFVKNGNQWRGKLLTREAVDAFRDRRKTSTIGKVFAHASYLINLASFEEPTYSRSLEALTDELDRCSRLGVDGLVLHPGAHLGHGVAAGIKRVAASLKKVFASLPGGKTRLLLENTAGQGTYLGHTLEELRSIRNQSGHARRIGFCLDTCHAFAAGAELNTRQGLQSWLDDVDDRLGLGRVHLFHLNDSLGACGSRRDRHANIGQGLIGSRPFGDLMRAPQLAEIPKVIETPSGESLKLHRSDLERLKGQARRKVKSAPLVVDN